MVRKKNRIERILEPFGAAHASALVSFFNEIASQDVDVVIFMARKALCLYKLFVLCGARRIESRIATESIIKNPDELIGKKIIVVDDTLFVGTTLAEVERRLEKIKIESVIFYVYCGDVGNWDEDTFCPDFLMRELSSQEIIEFCAAECRALINAGIPYLTDFPASHRISFTSSELDRAITPHCFNFFDISTQYHDTNKVKYYSGLPDKYIEESIRKQLGSSVYEVIELAKIRIFATWVGNRYEVTIVPIVTVGSLTKKDLIKCVSHLCEIFNFNFSLIGNRDIKEIMRFFQFIVGSLYQKLYFESIKAVKEVPTIKFFDSSWADFLFSEEVSKNISNLISQIYSGSKKTITKKIPRIGIYEPKSEVEKTKIDINKFLSEHFSNFCFEDFQDTPLSDLTAIFLEFHANFEEKARDEIRQKKKDPEYIGRLKKGMPWGELSRFILNKYSIKNNRYKRNVLSLILDRLVDFGIAVPIIATANNIVYRAYRHGEDVRFGAQEENLVYNILKGFQAGRGVEGFEGTYLEKIIVILLRVGMNEEWLDLWFSKNPSDNIVRIGYYLQGAVPIVPNRDEFLPENESSWLTRRLVKTGVLTQDNSKSNLYHLGEQEPDAAHAKRESKRTAISLGVALGKACTHSNTIRTDIRPLGTKDLIVLTSCSNLLDVAGAVAAELPIFADWYKRTGKDMLVGSGLRRAKKNITVYGYVPGRPNLGAEAINSGMWKIDKFLSDQIGEIKKKVYKLEGFDEEWINREEIWDAIFKAFERGVDNAERKSLEQLLKLIKVKLNESLWVLDLMEIIFFHRKNIIIGPQYEKIHNRLFSNSNKLSFNSPESIKSYKKLEDKLSAKKLFRNEDTALSFDLDELVERHCQVLVSDSQLVFNKISKSHQRLYRKIYKNMVWYDIIDMRGRDKNLQSELDDYVKGIDTFREEVNDFLQVNADRISALGGEQFTDNGENKSLNDSKHVYFSGTKSPENEAFYLSNELIKIASKSNIKIRIMVVDTSLRGDFVFRNKGETTVDGDFKSHFHTLIEAISRHEFERAIKNGESILWCMTDKEKSIIKDSFITYEDLDPSVEVSVKIRMLETMNSLKALICRA
ncbi:hypothetical protein IMCC1989_2488 [gamma proteobacterium IMCC1989]|nr:hypothetical protein IMCC1989_2488 [gamma proteobacterium IMCC1989]